MEFHFTDQLNLQYLPLNIMKVFTIYTLCMNRCIEMPQNAIHKIAIEKIINVKRLDPLNIKEF